MGDAYAIIVCNWDKWQTYRTDRGQPPWIKLHRRLLRNAEWISLTDAQRGQLVAIWMLAADNNGVIATPTWRQGGVKAASRLIRQLCHMNSEPDLELFKQLGFITYDANVTPQNRIETDKIREEYILSKSKSKARNKSNGQLSDEESARFSRFWTVYPKHQGKKAAIKAWLKAGIDDTVLNKILEALKWQIPEWEAKSHKHEYTPLPATYINGTRWDDEPPVKREWKTAPADPFDGQDRLFMDRCAEIQKEHPDWTIEQVAEEAGK